MSKPDARVRSELAKRLRERQPEIEQATLTRVYAIADPAEIGDPTYTDSLRAAVLAAIDYGLQGIENSERNSLPIPAILLMQARLAARNRISLDLVLRRYFAGYTLLGDFVLKEADEGDLLGISEIKRLLRTQAVLFDRLVAAITDEYERDARDLPRTLEERRVDQVERLLEGELLDTSELQYEPLAHHLGVVAVGPNASSAIRIAARKLGCSILLVQRGESVWAWLGARREPISPERLENLLNKSVPQRASVAIGEPGYGLSGWRMTHRQANAALPVALRTAECVVRYAKVALLASMLGDDLLATSLRELYLAPLRQERDGGAVARETLRAYFDTERNVSSTAAALRVDRSTVTNRLHRVEECVGRPLSTCAAEVEAALRLEDLEDHLAFRGKEHCSRNVGSHGLRNTPH